MKSLWLKTALAAALVLLPAQEAGAASAGTAGSSPAPAVNDIENSWAKDEIEKWLSLGLIKGYEDGTFKPGASITRAEFIALINRALGVKLSSDARASYSDVKKQDWFAADVAAAQSQGYVQGYEDGGFHPLAFISRSEAAVIVYRILKLAPAGQNEDRFSDDAAIPAWAKEAVYTLKSKGLLGGYADGKFQGSRNIARGETVVLLGRALLDDKETGGSGNGGTGSGGTGAGGSGNGGTVAGGTGSGGTGSGGTGAGGTGSGGTGSGGTGSGGTGSGGSGGNGSGNNGGTGSGGTGSGGSGATENVELAPSVKPLSDQTANQLAAVSGNGSELTFNGTGGEVANLHQGDIVTIPPSSQFPTGAAKKIVSVKTSGGQTIVTTVTPELSEVAHAINLHDEVPLAPSDLILADGVTLQTTNHNQSRSGRSLARPFARGLGAAPSPMGEIQLGEDFNFTIHKQFDADIEPNDDGITGGVHATFDGQFLLKAPTVSFDYDWEFPFTIAQAELKLNGEQHMEAHVHGNAKLVSKQKLELFKSKPMLIGETGAYIIIEASLFFNTDGSASFDFDYSTTATESLGFSYDNDKGGKPIIDFDMVKDINMPVLQGKLKQEVGLSLAPSLEFLGINLTTLALEGGLYSDFSGSLSLESDAGDLGLKGCYAIDNGWFVRANLSFNDELGLKDLGGNILGPDSFYKFDSCDNLQSIAAKKAQYLLGAGQSEQLQIDGKLTTGEERDVTFESTYASSDPSLVSVDSNGSVTVAEDAPLGREATITVTNRGKTTQLVVKVDIIDITVTPTVLRIKPGASQPLAVTSLIRPGVTEDVTRAADITYTSSDTNLVRVDRNGVLTAADSRLESDVTITVTYHDKTKLVQAAFRQDAGDIILRAEKAAGELFSKEAAKQTPDSYETIKPQLASYYTDTYMNKVWKKVYQADMKWFLEPNYLFPLTDGLRDTKTVSESAGKKTVSVDVPVVKFSNGQKIVTSAKIRYQYTLVQRNGVWYIDDISGESVKNS